MKKNKKTDKAYSAKAKANKGCSKVTTQGECAEEEDKVVVFETLAYQYWS